ncbi:MAG: STAS domain-containing protein [Planctomycetia bacterium]|nr:STAS domain-containing protein [Planctomycetia bacterium]
MTVSKYFEVGQGEITTIRFTEPELFDTILVTELKEQLINFTERETPEKLLLDFSEVEFCSTAVINTLLRIKKIVVRDGGGQLRLCGMRPNVRSAF